MTDGLTTTGLGGHAGQMLGPMPRHPLAAFVLLATACGAGDPTPTGFGSEPTDPGSTPTVPTWPANPACAAGAPARVMIDQVGYDGLAAALSAAEPGATLTVCPGTYPGPVEALVPVQIVGLGTAADVVLQGDGLASTLTLPGGSAIANLGITGGGGGLGAGLSVTSPGELSIDAVDVYANQGGVGGGIALVSGVDAVFTGTTVRDNLANLGGGLWIDAGATVDLGDTLVSANLARDAGGGAFLAGAITGGQFDGNACTNPFGWPNPSVGGGGGLFATGDAALAGATVTANNALTGGGIAVTDGVLTLTDVVVDGNTAYFAGGGIACAGCVLTLDGDTIVSHNTAASGAGASLYGGVAAGGSFEANTATEYGGGVQLIDSQLTDAAVTANLSAAGAGVAVTRDSALARCEVTGNAADGHGGGLSTVGDNVSVAVLDSTLAGNTAGTYGGGLWSSGEVSLTGGLVADNAAGLGAALFGATDAALVAVETEIARNASVSGGAVDLTISSTFLAWDVVFGPGADANTPSDVFAGGFAYAALGDGARLSCGPTGCAPLVAFEP